jgi:hypothetical protein
MSLYYESHVTLEPVLLDSHKLQLLEVCSKTYDFRLAKLYMAKLDNLEPHNLDCFTTGRSENLNELLGRMLKFIKHLKTLGFIVRRYKIESALLDSKIQDPLNLLESK